MPMIPKCPIKVVLLPPAAPPDVDPNFAAVIMTHGRRAMDNALHTLIAHYNGSRMGDSQITTGLSAFREYIGLGGQKHMLRLMDSQGNLLPQTRVALKAMIPNIEHYPTFMDGAYARVGTEGWTDGWGRHTPRALINIRYAPWVHDYMENLWGENSMIPVAAIGPALAVLEARFSDPYHSKGSR